MKVKVTLPIGLMMVLFLGGATAQITVVKTYVVKLDMQATAHTFLYTYGTTAET
ncbi:hypothetical protein BDD43_5368 [Mucilaginibacter gracilis]|uniref:Uncharacterized protein n=1 Tax=Mucilaginibacter gracilis TaxID=423350 RepID=A0A495J7Y7_9SPHI|nr:hypothetical protein [Mucilaginibacter gracilis]RKR85110.1 hypothetical protein BDD43_5368 [Mucilaginibacter gracilis]